jgi:hypothetical protein
MYYGYRVYGGEDRPESGGHLSRERPARQDAADANWIAKTAASSEQQEPEHVPRLDIGQERLVSRRQPRISWSPLLSLLA